MFFHQPTSIEVPECELLQKIDGVGYYADTTKDIGKYNLSCETINSFVESYQEKDIEMLELLIKMGIDLNATYFKGNILLGLLNKEKIDIKAIELLLAHGANLPNLKGLNENHTQLIKKYTPLINFADSLLDGELNDNQLYEDYITNCVDSEEFIPNIKFIKEKITNKMCNAANIKDLMKWTANLEKNLNILKNNELDALFDLTTELCIFGGNSKVTPIWLKTLNKIASESDGLVTKEQFKNVQCLFGTKLKFVAVKNIFDTIKILPTEIGLDHSINQSDILEVELVAENHEDN
jgi:hypothetical protein